MSVYNVSLWRNQLRTVATRVGSHRIIKNISNVNQSRMYSKSVVPSAMINQNNTISNAMKKTIDTASKSVVPLAMINQNDTISTMTKTVDTTKALVENLGKLSNDKDIVKFTVLFDTTCPKLTDSTDTTENLISMLKWCLTSPKCSDVYVMSWIQSISRITCAFSNYQSHKSLVTPLLPLLIKHENSTTIQITADDVVGLFKSLVMVEINADQVGSNLLQAVVAKYVGRLWNELDHNQIIDCIKRISQMGIMWDTLPLITQTQLLFSIRKNQYRMSLQEGAEMVFQLGKMHLNLEARSMSEKEVMFDIVGDIAKDVKGKQSVTNADVDRMALALMGLTTMNLKFLKLPVLVRKRLVGTLLHLDGKMGSDNRAEITTALKTLGVDLGVLLANPHNFILPPPVTPLVALHAMSAVLSEEVGNGVQWTDMPPDIVDAFYHSVDYHLVGPSAELDVRALFSALSMLSSLGKGGAQWTLLPVKVRYGLLVALCNVNVLSLEDMTGLLKAFNALKLTWPSLPAPLQDKLKHDLQKRVTTQHLHDLVGCMHQLVKFHPSKGFIPQENINDALRIDGTRLTPRGWAVLVVSLANLQYSYSALTNDATQQLQHMLTAVIWEMEVLDMEKALNALPLLTADAAYVSGIGAGNNTQVRVTQLWMLHEALLRGYREAVVSKQTDNSSSGDDPLDGFTQINCYVDFMTHVTPNGRNFVRRVLCEGGSGYTPSYKEEVVEEVEEEKEVEEVFSSSDVEDSAHRRTEDENEQHLSFDSGVVLV